MNAFSSLTHTQTEREPRDQANTNTISGTNMLLLVVGHKVDAGKEKISNMYSTRTSFLVICVINLCQVH